MNVSKKKNIETIALLAVIGGNVIFGFSFLFSKMALDLVPPTVLVAVRFTVAFIVLNIIVLFGKIIGKIKGKAPFEFSLRGKPKKDIIMLAICQPIIYFAGESYGIKMTSSSFAGIIIALIPIAGIVADALIMKAKIGKIQVVCALLSVVGVALTTLGAKNMESSGLGVILLFVAVVSGSFFYVFSNVAGKHYNPLERTYVMFGLGSITYIVVAVIQTYGSYADTLKGIATPSFWISIAYLAVVSSVVAFLLLNFGSNFISISKATLMANSTTVISIVAGVVVLGESFTWPQIVGAVIILASVTVGELRGRG